MPSPSPSRLSAYADLILQVGLNLQPGQRLLIVGTSLHGVDLSLAPFVRLVAQRAYAIGASYVDVVWWDPELELLRLRQAPPDSLGRFPQWFGAAQLESHQAGDAFLVIYAEDPNLFASIQPEAVSAHLAGIRSSVAAARQIRMRNAINWCVVAAPVAPWAATVLPQASPEAAEERLWELILSVCRLDQADPVDAWRMHVGDLSARAEYLTRMQYAALRYRAPGTNLTVGLPRRHIWHGGQIRTESGVAFVPNLPTEEVFTTPDCRTAEGTLTSTRPFEYGGTSIEGMTLTFSAGKVVEFSAKVGEPSLRELLHADEGSARLGEVALVPHSSPVSKAGVVFHNILFDENAASHLALGFGFRFCFEGGEADSDEAFAARGGNLSQLHYDFMIGSETLDVDGVTDSGEVQPLLRGGEWAFRP